MAKKEVTLTLSYAEEHALARLIGYLCKSEASGTRKELSGILGHGHPDVDRIAQINAALNASR